MPIFDPTQLGSQGRVFDGCNVSVTVGGKPAPANSVKGIGANTTVEGKEHQYALGSRKPFAKTAGIIKPGETTLIVFTAMLDQFLACWDETGNYLDIPRDVVITLDEKSSPGLAGLANVLKMGTKTIRLTDCEIIGLGSTFETGGAALVTEVKVMPTDIEWMGFAGSSR